MPEDNTQLNEANILYIKAQAIRQLVDGGFAADQAVKAVNSGDLSVLSSGMNPAA